MGIDELAYEFAFFMLDLRIEFLPPPQRFTLPVGTSPKIHTAIHFVGLSRISTDHHVAPERRLRAAEENDGGLGEGKGVFGWTGGGACVSKN